ncbi:hypothetical protein JCM19233_1051 [Vibrio astriarenae]|nr:hypothetical protein JCM19233_1051 [Vibrio sp. C7]
MPRWLKQQADFHPHSCYSLIVIASTDDFVSWYSTYHLSTLFGDLRIPDYIIKTK